MLNGPIIASIASTSGMRATARAVSTDGCVCSPVFTVDIPPPRSRLSGIDGPPEPHCIRGSSVGSAYIRGQPSSGASGNSSKCHGSLT